VLLIVSDMHFGKAARNAERAKEADLLALLDSLQDELEAVYLLGDVSDQYVEYRHLIPKGFVRFQGRLAQLTDSGIPVHYIVGNHDPWHIDYFEQELGVRVHREPITLQIHERSMILGHGDGAGIHPVPAMLRRVVRHPIPFALFRTLLPADAAHRLTRWTKSRFGSNSVEPQTIERLEHHARELLEGEADVVVLGHSHRPQCVEHGRGVYMNTGSWHVDRTYATVTKSSIVLRQWNGEDVSVYLFHVAENSRSGH
jgi:UDP-2,3-diacylglucosamine hydrolase